MAQPLDGTCDQRRSLERAIDWLVDGVALIAADGAVVHANDAFQAVVGRNDGIYLRHDMIEFASVDARRRMQELFGRLRGADALAPAYFDFVVPQRGTSVYLVSVRPLGERQRDGRAAANEAAVVVFVRDPARRVRATRLLREVFGLTEAEADLAQALQHGVPPAEHARACAISLNTVHTHLRRIRQKTGCKHLVQLIRRLNDLQVFLRS